MSMKNYSDTIGNRTRDLPACSAVPHPTAPPRAPKQPLVVTWNHRNVRQLKSVERCETKLFIVLKHHICQNYFKIQFLTKKKVSITELLLLRAINAVYCENHTKTHKYTVLENCGAFEYYIMWYTLLPLGFVGLHSSMTCHTKNDLHVGNG